MTKQLKSKKIVPYIISCVYFMESIDSTIVNTAIPAMANSLHVGPINLKIALISYFLSLAIFIPISGWLTDKFGAKKVFIFALFIFTLGSLWCGFSHYLSELIVARFMQGLGGAFGLPVGRLIIVRLFGRENLIVKMNRVITVGALGMMLGPVIGGFIIHYFSWQWIFWINVPIGILTMLLANRYLEESKLSSVPPLDKVGFFLFGAALAGFTLGLSELSERNIDPFLSYSITFCSFGLFIGYIFHANHRQHTIVKTDLLRIKTFQISVLGNLISRLGFGAVPFLLPLLFQISLGLSAEKSGLLLAPVALGILTAKPLAIHILRLFGYKRFLIVNTTCSALSIALFASINTHTSFAMTSGLTFIYGFILALQYSAMNSIAYADIQSEDLSAATSIMGTIQQLTHSFGVAISALLIRFFSFIYTQDTLTLTIFHGTFLVMACLTLSSVMIFVRLGADDGHEMIKTS